MGLGKPKLHAMDLHQWLDIPRNRGKAQELAQHLGVHKTAVSLWRDNGVPLDRMAEVSRFSKGVVKIKDMVEHAMAARAKPKAEA